MRVYILIDPFNLTEKEAQILNTFLANPRASILAKEGNRGNYLAYINDIEYEFDFYIHDNKTQPKLLFDKDKYLLIGDENQPIASLQAGSDTPIISWFTNVEVKRPKPFIANNTQIIDLLNLNEQTNLIIHTYLKNNPKDKIRRSKSKPYKNKQEERTYKVETNNTIQEFKLLESQRLVPYKDNEFLLIDEEKAARGENGKIFFPKAIVKVEETKISINVEEAKKLIVKIPTKQNNSKFNSIEDIPIVKEVRKAVKAYSDRDDLPKPCFNSYKKNGKEIYYAILPRFEGVSLYSITWGNNFSNFTYEKRRDLIVRPLWNAIKNFHSKEMVHGDFTPVNCMVDGKGSVNLIDFGNSLERYDFKNTQEFIDYQEFEFQSVMFECYDIFNLRRKLALSDYQDFCREYFNTTSQPDIDNFLQVLETYYRKELNLLEIKSEIISQQNCSQTAKTFCRDLQNKIFANQFETLKGNIVYLKADVNNPQSNDIKVPNGVKRILEAIESAKQVEINNPHALVLQQKTWEQTLTKIKDIAIAHSNYNPVKKFLFSQHTSTEIFYKNLITELENNILNRIQIANLKY